MSRSDKLIPRLIKTNVYFAPIRMTDKLVNKNPNNLIANKPILEIEKPIWKTESILLATLHIQEFTVLEKGETTPYF